MTGRRSFPGSVYVSLSLSLLPIAWSGSLSLAASSPLAAFDMDYDGTLDLAEVKTAASSVFDKLEKDHETALDRQEARGHLSDEEFSEADIDKDATLTKDEYLTLVEKLFKAADADQDGTLDDKELHSTAGSALLRLLR